MPEANVTIIVVPRERFNYTQKSLESIYANTETPFKLIYVDGNSPGHIRRYLETAAEKYSFKLIRTEQYLAPNQARNIGLSQVDTEFVVFIDNDVLVKSGWLDALMRCEERTEASIIAPLTMEGEAFDTIHQAGGEVFIREAKNGRRLLIERRPYMHLAVSKLKQPLQAESTQLCEFHCVFARKDLFNEVGLLDEKLMSIAEETDFCLSALNAGKTIHFEPKSVVSYVLPTELSRSDLPFFFIRWSDAWCKTSMERLRQTYSLSVDAPIFKHYLDFVYSHRYFAFGQEELRTPTLLFSNGLSPLKKVDHLYKKFCRRRMNQEALSANFYKRRDCQRLN